MALGDCLDCFTESSSPKDVSEEILAEEKMVWGENEERCLMYTSSEMGSLCCPQCDSTDVLGLSHRPVMCRWPQNAAEHFPSKLKGFSLPSEGEP